MVLLSLKSEGNNRKFSKISQISTLDSLKGRFHQLAEYVFNFLQFLKGTHNTLYFLPSTPPFRRQYTYTYISTQIPDLSKRGNWVNANTGIWFQKPRQLRILRRFRIFKQLGRNKGLYFRFGF